MASPGFEIIEALDTIDEVSRVVICMGVAVASRPLDEYESSGVTAVLRWSAQRLDDSLNVLKGAVFQDDKAPN